MKILDEKNTFQIGKDYSYDIAKSKIVIKGQENSIIIGDGLRVDKNILISIEGKNNNVVIGNNFCTKGNFTINITGDNNNIKIGTELKTNSDLVIEMKQNSKNSFLIIGDYLNIETANIQTHGQSNKVSIADYLKGEGKLSLNLQGDNNEIKFKSNITIVSELAIYMCMCGQNRNLFIGNDTSFYKTEIHNYDHGSSVIIGKDCMFSYNTVIYNTDGHSIFQNGKLINQARTCEIGNHVWIGYDATIMKNSKISNGSIIARKALVCKTFKKENCILAGIPAKIVKENIEWSRQTINEALELSSNSSL